MKKTKLDPLTLDKDTISKLNIEQLTYVLGGKDECSQFEWCCRFGGSTPAASTGCGAGGSTCALAN